MDTFTTGINFDLPKNKSNVIKVIGVGGGGSNAINYMFQQGIMGVDFVVCNTDAQALEKSAVPIKIQLGASLTEGLGAGANPDVGRQSAQESYDDLHTLLSTQTKMVFITAGMGGGTGTGAAPIIARMAKDLDVLTVGIVTMPFQFEGKIRLEQAQKGMEELKNNVDSLIVINNNKLREVYGNLGFKAGFSKADEVLATAARGIAEVITHHYTQNIDLKDAKTVLTNSGSAIMGSASASGANRAQESIVKALDSPLLNDNKITGCKNVLLLIVSGEEEITIDEIGEINDFIQSEAGNNTNIIMGVGDDPELGDSISVTIIATGFNSDQQHEIVNTEAKKVIHTLEEDQPFVHDLTEKKEATSAFSAPIVTPEVEEPVVKFTLEEDPVEEVAETIVAVNVPELESVCCALLKAGAGRILVEKPGGVDMAALERLGTADLERRMRIAYNRRFLPSVQKAAELITEDDGAQVLSFEFTELGDRIKAANVHPPEVLAHWYLANSSHVFDLAFHVAGSAGDLSDVTTLAAAASGTLDWHPAGARFVGCGSFAEAGLFNYSADWQSGGGWGVEVTTSQRKLTLKPLERLSQQMRNTFDVTPVDIRSEPEGLKPGLLGLVQDFLSFDGAGCPDIQAHIARMKTFSAMIKSPV